MQGSTFFHWHRIVSAPKQMVSLWNRSYDDARIILEQGGDLRYLVVSASLQKKLVRGLIVLTSLAASAILVLALTSFVLHAGKVRLENSHREIYAALLSGTEDLDLEGEFSLSADDMLTLAQSIRERDAEIRRMVGTATSQLSEENVSLTQKLAASGLTSRAIKAIQSSGAVGGQVDDAGVSLDPLLRGSFLEASAKNQELKDVLLALPHKIPVNDYRLTSKYGVRTHPISNKPSFHAGIDLVSTGDDRIYPSLPGRVIMARPYHNYGKTVIIRHERGIETLYAHLDQIDVKEGQEVDTQTLLGMMGNTGASTGKHLHFEVSIGGYPVDPLKVIATAQYVQQAKVEFR